MKKKIFIVFVGLVALFGTTPVFAKSINDDTSNVEYIKGRPLTDREIKEQKLHEPKLEEVILEDFKTDNTKLDYVGDIFQSVYDARSDGIITDVKDQGQTQLCWDFATLSLVETAMIKDKVTVDGIVSNKDNVDLSEAFLGYFYYNRVNDTLGNTLDDRNIYNDSTSTFLDNAGNGKQCAISLSSWCGVTKENIYSLEDAWAGKKPDDSLAYSNNISVLKNIYFIDTDINKMKSAIVNYGSVGVSICLDTDIYYNYNTAAYSDPNDDTTNHMVAIVGWDDNYSKDNFNTGCNVQNNGAWIVKNSWSKGWGDEGYFYVSYEDKSLVACASLEMQETNNYDNNYFYDGSAAPNIEKVHNGGMISNVYEVKGNRNGSSEALKAISFISYTSNVNYEVQIYKNLTNRANPMSGTLVTDSTVKGTTTFGGLYTVKLGKEVLLKDGENFSVVISLSANNETEVVYGVDENWNYTWVSFISNTSPQQSFYNNINVENAWIDLGQTATRESARIKAYTSDVYEVIFKDGNNIISKQYLDEGQAAIVPSNLKKNGYTLTWDKKFNEVKQDITVNAVWIPNQYYVNLNSNGGNQVKSSKIKVKFDSVYGKLENPSRKGYLFQGWYTDKINGTKIAYSSKVKILSDITLYAHWNKINVNKVSINSAKNIKNKSVQTVIKKVNNVNGYQVQYSVKSNMKSSKTITSNLTKQTIKKLKYGKTYYIRARAYRIDSTGGKVYGTWSAKKKVIIKK